MIGASTAAGASHSLAAVMVRRIWSVLPASSNGDGELFALNLSS